MISPMPMLRCMTFLLANVITFALTVGAAKQLPAAETVEVRKIWDQPGRQSFFTDLIRFRNQWICTFREAATHNSDDGRVRLIASSDGKMWSSLAQIESPPPNQDLRDPKLSITPQGKLMLTATAYRPQPECRSYVWFSDDGKEWSEPHRIGPPGEWLWRTEWRQGYAYNFGRSEKRHSYLQLYRSLDGKVFEPHGPRQFDGIYVNETAPVFQPDSTCVTLLRRDSENNTAQIGTSRPPYEHWTWKDLGVRIGGPEMIQLPDGRLLATVRLYEPDEHTSLCWIEPEAGTLDEFLKLPSGGDTSYAGTVWHEGLVWISYYSSHEGMTSIYLAKVRVD
ncbi:sialidase family protein [Pirellulales bacterium]|nr:sialidase family protein [Pirellulales bacterium]